VRIGAYCSDLGLMIRVDATKVLTQQGCGIRKSLPS